MHPMAEMELDALVKADDEMPAADVTVPAVTIPVEFAVCITRRVRRLAADWGRQVCPVMLADARLTFEIDGNVTLAYLTVSARRFTGWAKRNPTDPDNPTLGMYTALRRAVTKYAKAN